MKLNSAGYVSIAEIVVYIPLLLLAIVVCSRHGFSKSSGWIYTVVLSVIRIAGSACQLLTYTNHSASLLQWTMILDSVGVSPLLLATLGMLSRFVDWVNLRGYNILSIKHFRLVQLLITVGLILSIVGGTSSSKPAPNGTIDPSTISKVGDVLYIVAFFALLCFLLIASRWVGSAPRQERRIPVAVGLAMPLILTRLAYSTLAVFLHDKTFSVVGGSVPVRAGMAVVEEMLVAVIYVGLGFTLRKLDAHEQGELTSRPWKEPKRGGRREHGRVSRHSHGGVVSGRGDQEFRMQGS